MRGNSGSGPGPVTFVLGIVVILIVLGCITAIMVNLSPQLQASGDAQVSANYATAQATNHTMVAELGDRTHQPITTTGTVIIDGNTIFLTPGSSETITFDSPQAGSYRLTLYSDSSLNAYPSSLSVSINGEPATEQSFKDSQSNCSYLCLQTTPITVMLHAGQNTVTISNVQTPGSASCNTNDPYIKPYKPDMDNCNFILSIELSPPDNGNGSLYAWIGVLVLIVIAIVAAFLFFGRGKKR